MIYKLKTLFSTKEMLTNIDFGRNYAIIKIYGMIAISSSPIVHVSKGEDNEKGNCSNNDYNEYSAA
jgi:hypothetical protein